MNRVSSIALALLLAASPVGAQDKTKLVGTWKLVSFDIELQSGEPARPFLGQKWTGYTIFTPEGRTMSVWEAEGRKPPENDADRAALFRTMNAITGTYSYDGGTGVTDVDVAANPAGKGKQTRGYKLDGNRLEVTTPWAPNQSLPGSPVARLMIRFERASP